MADQAAGASIRFNNRVLIPVVVVEAASTLVLNVIVTLTSNFIKCVKLWTLKLRRFCLRMFFLFVMKHSLLFKMFHSCY
jgi:hypothetical protein